MKSTRQAQMEALDRPVVVPVEDIQVGDLVTFVGYPVGDAIGGWRVGTVKKVYPRLRVLRVDKTAKVNGEEILFWRTRIHETRLLENHGAVKREVD